MDVQPGHASIEFPFRCSPRAFNVRAMSSPAPAPERGKILWQPKAASAQRSRLAAYQRWLAEKHGLNFPDYDSLWRWSVTDIGKFWSTIAEYFEVKFHRAAAEPAKGS